MNLKQRIEKIEKCPKVIANENARAINALRNWLRTLPAEDLVFICRFGTSKDFREANQSEWKALEKRATRYEAGERRNPKSRNDLNRNQMSSRNDLLFLFDCTLLPEYKAANLSKFNQITAEIHNEYQKQN